MSTPVLDNSQARPDPFCVGSVANPQWANAEKTMIQCMVTFPYHSLGYTAPMPFTADSRDSETHGQALFHRLASGEFGTIGNYQPPSDDLLDGKAQSIVADALVRTQLRVDQHRDELEAGGETTLTAAQFSTLQNYRADLRNIKKQAGYPKVINWPDEPAL
jgi:hypothetical protein